jgi:hypothetical protein
MAIVSGEIVNKRANFALVPLRVKLLCAEIEYRSAGREEFAFVEINDPRQGFFACAHSGFPWADQRDSVRCLAAAATKFDRAT